MTELYKDPNFDNSIIDDRYLVYNIDTMGFTLLHWAVKKNDIGMVKMLLESPSGDKK